MSPNQKTLMKNLQEVVPKAGRFGLRQISAKLFDSGQIDNRKALWQDVRKNLAIADAAQCLKKILPLSLNVSEAMVRQYFTELKNFQPLKDLLAAHKKVLNKDFEKKTLGVGLTTELFCYVACRFLQPSVIVETGCATGWTSALFLLAIHHNHKGHLYTVDLSAKKGEQSMDWSLPDGVEIGFLVPEELKKAWTLIQGNALDELMPLLNRLGNVEVFFHDSDHTYNQMMWEYTAAWSHLTDGGILISDDIGWNTAFWDFAVAENVPMAVHKNNPNFGALVKTSSNNGKK
ncbi:MAG: class I SAM-dependent methyltransferase [Candidatus Omnitrophica bacterium]|nr:class I SAM-dependent methyltransferase [Candidatus Omnitrophota bacterium]